MGISRVPTDKNLQKLTKALSKASLALQELADIYDERGDKANQDKVMLQAMEIETDMLAIMEQCPDCGGDCDSILKAAQASLAMTWNDALDILVGRGIVLKMAAQHGKYSLWKDGKLYLGTSLTKKQVIGAAAALPATA